MDKERILGKGIMTKKLFFLLIGLILLASIGKLAWNLGYSQVVIERVEIVTEIPVIPEWLQELYNYDPATEPMTYEDALYFLVRMRKSHVYQVEHAAELGHDAERIRWELEEVILYERLIEYIAQ